MKFVRRTLYVLLLLLGMTILGILLYPVSKYEPREREVYDESSFDFESRVGWYRLTDGSSRLLTWGAENGLMLYRFGLDRDSLARTRFRIRSDTVVEAGPESKFDRIVFADASESVDENPLLVLKDGSSQRMKRLGSSEYRTREVRFSNAGVELAGLLFVPNSPGRHPAAVFIHGSGDSDRDNFWYLSPADHLARNGVVVLLPDKRGCGKSEGEWHTASFDDYAGDAVAAIELLNQHPSVDGNRLGVVGFSQGGWVAPLAASKSPLVTFAAIVSGSLARPVDQLAYEVRSDIAASGAPNFAARLVEPLFSWRAKRKQPEWWDLNGDFDPLVHWRNLRLPTLMILGGDDRNVDVTRTLFLLDDSGLKEPSTVDAVVLAERSHTLMSPQTRWIDSAYLDELTTFLLKRP